MEWDAESRHGDLARMAPLPAARYRWPKPVSFLQRGVASVSFRRSASFVLVAGTLSAGCGARSGLECFGETCSSLNDNPAGFDPDDDFPSAGAGGSTGRGGSAGIGSGGSGARGGRGGSSGRGGSAVVPEEIPSSTPIDTPAPQVCREGVFDGSIDVSSTEQLAGLERCEVIDGDLTIFGVGIADLRPLSRLRTVTRSLNIVSYGGTLDGLEALEAVDSLTLDNTTVLTLEPLRNLRQIGGFTGFADTGVLRLNQNHNLTSLSGLGSLVEEVSSIEISNNGSLTSLVGLNVPGQLQSVSLSGNPLSDVDGLLSLQLVETLLIEESPSLTSLSGLANLQAVVTLSLVNDVSLSELTLPVGSIDVLYLDNVGVTSLNGLSNISRIENAVIQRNPNLVDIDRLGSLETLAELSVLDNPSLVRLPDFVGLTDLQQLHVRGNPLLAAGPGYPLVADAGSLLISENPSLTNLTGFATLQRARTIDISRNANLVEVDLGTLGSVRNVRITCNTALPESPLQTMLSEVAGTIDVWGNQGSATACP
jgi:hypothetical protein